MVHTKLFGAYSVVLIYIHRAAVCVTQITNLLLSTSEQETANKVRHSIVYKLAVELW